MSVQRGRSRAHGAPRVLPGARLTGGDACGRRLVTVTGRNMRASTGLVRAACFNILGEMVQGADILDLFGGIGSLGLEALSRGAASATFVELRRDRAAVISENASILGYGPLARVVTGDAIAWLGANQTTVPEFQVILMDPPYLEAGPTTCLRALEILGVIAGRSPQWRAVVVVEHHRQLQVPEVVGSLTRVRESQYGMTTLSFYREQP